MTAKEYLEQGIGLNHRINSKIARISKLKDLAVNISVIYTDMPKKPNCGGSKLEDTVIKMVSLEEEINHDIVRLLDMQNEISKCIDSIKDEKQHTVLELRYLAGKSWEEIAGELGCGIDNVYRLHRKALETIEIPDIDESKTEN